MCYPAPEMVGTCVYPETAAPPAGYSICALSRRRKFNCNAVPFPRELRKRRGRLLACTAPHKTSFITSSTIHKSVLLTAHRHELRLQSRKLQLWTEPRRWRWWWRRRRLGQPSRRKAAPTRVELSSWREAATTRVSQPASICTLGAHGRFFRAVLYKKK